MIRNALLAIFSVFMVAGCQPDYGIVGEIGTEYVFVEVPKEGPHTEIWVDSFIQPTSMEGVDILWVIDTSGSMHDDEPRLLAGIEAMMNSLPAQGWRLNMISNSPPHVHKDAQFPLVPGDDLIDAKTMFYGMTGGVYEQGFDALESYLYHNPYANQWMRDDAALLVVFVSDEEDQSNQSVAEFVNYYTGLRDHVFLASIVHLDPAESLCNVSTYNTGYNSIDATQQLGGVVVDICSEDWAPGVKDASAQVEPYEELELTHRPVDNDIYVFINGVPNYDWHYVRSDNTVYFDIIPESNDLVEIAYPYLPLEFEVQDTLPFN
tara:strand:- start:746 stop:1705 length:960 start_codon:yes stop_codon:yes gene_type:complete